MISTIQIGKKGLTEELIKEVKKQLKKKTVRIKILRAAMPNKNRVVEELKEKTGAKQTKQLGNTLIIKKSI